MDRSPRLLGALIVVAAALLLGVAMAVSYVLDADRDAARSLPGERLQAGRSVPPLPKVGLPGAVPPEQELLALAPETAREINARRPFSTAPNPAARAFASKWATEDRDRAITCLATAALYEAGSQADDQYPVMQVILNRVRHPAFPASVCGVVFQGAERSTGCQFSFTCDGSLGRWRPSDAAMRDARVRAGAMLGGHVDRRVGLATHYHTDWVVPYWSTSLDKITAVKTHLFFRWTGFWGTRAAFRRDVGTTEPRIALLGGFSSAHLAAGEVAADAPALPEGPQIAAESLAAIEAVAPAPARPRAEVLPLTLDPAAKPGRWAIDALALCGKRADCRAVGWIDPARRPATLDADALAAAPPDFVFVQELRNRVQQPYWNCDKWPKASTSRCLDPGSHAARLAYGG